MAKKSKFEESMEKVGLFIEEKLAPPLVKFGNQRHMVAIRSALIRTIPMIIVGCIPLLLTSFPAQVVVDFFAPYAVQINTLNSMTFGFISLWLSISLASELSLMYDELDSVMCQIVTVCCYLIVVEPIYLSDGAIGTTGLSAKGMFSLFIIAIVVVEFMHFAFKHNIVIRMPKAVPANIANSFASLVSMGIIVVFFWFVRVIMGFDLTAFINTIISPILSVTDTLYAAIICSLITQILWFVGIHGGSFTIWGPMYPILLTNISENAAAKAAGEALPHILTEPFFYSWHMIGGVGCTLVLCFIWWNSRSKALREVARVSLIPGIFCVNEPVVFGAPIVFNPYLFIPFVFLSSVFGTIYGYVLTSLGIISAAYVQIPWSTPPLIHPLLSTGDWKAVVAQAILIALLFIIWYPFAKLWEKKCVEEEQANETLESNNT